MSLLFSVMSLLFSVMSLLFSVMSLLFSVMSACHCYSPLCQHVIAILRYVSMSLLFSVMSLLFSVMSLLFSIMSLLFSRVICSFLFLSRPVGMPTMEKIYLNNPSSEEISLISISATTAHFHPSCFQNGIIPAGGNTSFDLVFLARVVRNIENTLFINTSNHGVFTYQVFGVGISNPYRLRPFIGARVHVNGSFSPLINIHNPHSEPLQVVEMFFSGDHHHLDLPTGQQGGTKTFWDIPPFETKGVMRASFSSRDADNHTAFIRIKTNEDQFIILPVEVTSAPGIYSSTEMLDFGTLRSQDWPKQLNLHLLNSGRKDVWIASIRTTPSNEATINFKAITLEAGESRYTKVASISFDAERPVQFSGKITVKEINSSKLEVPYQAAVLQGYLGFDHTATLFHIRDSPVDPVNRSIFLTNAFNFAVRIHNVTLPDEVKTMFSVSSGASTITEWLNTDASAHIAYFLICLCPLDNSWGDVLCHMTREHGYSTNRSRTSLKRFFFCVFQILTIPVKAVIAVGKLNSYPEHIILPPSFPGKIVHQSFTIQSSFTQRARLRHIRSLTEDIRFYYKRLRSNKNGLEPRCKSKVANIYFDASLQCVDHCYVGLPFARPHGLVLQEDIWDADIDLHQKLLRRWTELKDRSGHQVEAVFEVSTDLQETVQATITAQQTWPSLVNASQQITFPLTNANSSSETEVVLENPADVPVYVQILPLALYPNPSVFAGKLGDRFPLGKLSNIDTKSLEFQVTRNLGSSGFVEGSTRPFVYNVLLQPGEVKSFSLRFTPSSNHSVSSLLIVRNNLTVIDVIVVRGQGTTGSLQVAGKLPGPDSSLRFQMTEVLLKDCTESELQGPSTLRRTFRVENAGLLPLYIRSAEINGQPCQGYGFKVLNCQQFTLKPNASEDLVILFTPDFTSSRVIRELKLVTEGGSEFVFVLNASLPFHMLASCTETLPRPSWELELYVIVSLVMSSMFLLVIAIAYLEAQGIWEPFKRHLSLDSPMETGRPFDLREIVRISSDCLASQISHPLNDFSDAHQNPTRGMYGSGSEVSRVGSRNSRASVDLDGQRARMDFDRSTMQASSTFSSSQLANGAPVSCQLTNRKARSSKRQQGGGLLDLQNRGPWSGSSLPHRRRCSGGEDPDYASLLGAMDNDLDRPESPPLQEHNVSLSTLNNDSKGKQLRGKTNAQRKRAEKERRAKGKPPPGDQLKDVLADNDDSSSTTTETSNPDVEASNKEEPVKKKGRTAVTLEKEETKPQNNKRQTNSNDQSSSLELPYITALENKQRKTFTSKALIHSALTTAPTARTLQKPRPGSLPHLNSSDCSVLGNGDISSSEGEKEFAATEWDNPLLTRTTNQADSLQQTSLQTMNADTFLKRPISARTYSHPRSSPSLVTRGTYSQVLNANSETNLKKAPGNKLANATSLPGKNGNPTFAAVAAGYDRSPGERSLYRFLALIPNNPFIFPLSSSGLWSPIGFNPANSFSAFGPNNSFNLTGGKDWNQGSTMRLQALWWCYVSS
uniref:Transmembrane protein 131 n=1 Tax=Oncorhynchus kisutch TaxID=8019 RepID=A0A8C7G601_ONCKI